MSSPTRRRRFLLDLSPLRESRDFRLLFVGQLAGVFGLQLALVAIPFQTYELTHSSLQVGAVSSAQLVPLIIGALLGGSLADARGRPVLVGAAIALAFTSGGLTLNAFMARPSLLALYLISALAAGAGGVLTTTASASVPALVRPRQLLAAFASMQVVDQVGMVAAPALAGVLLAALHPRWVFAAVAITFVLTALALARLSSDPTDDLVDQDSGTDGSRSARAGGGSRRGLGSVLGGLRYLKGRAALQGAFLIDLNAMVFGLPRALFPALAATVFHGGPRTLGLLYAAPGVGALLGALTTGWLERVRHQGRAVVMAVCAWGAVLVAFGLVHVLWLALVFLALAGWADVLSAVLRSTILQAALPESLRSRIASLQVAVVEGGPRLGDLEAGTVASLVTTEFSVVAGGVACVVGALALAGLLPGFRRYERTELADPSSLTEPSAITETRSAGSG